MNTKSYVKTIDDKITKANKLVNQLSEEEKGFLKEIIAIGLYYITLLIAIDEKPKEKVPSSFDNTVKEYCEQFEQALLEVA